MERSKKGGKDLRSCDEKTTVRLRLRVRAKGGKDLRPCDEKTTGRVRARARVRVSALLRREDHG